ncbi:MAG: hypothetical protein AB1Z98_07110 [Nannocystaceae bacterium]
MTSARSRGAGARRAGAGLEDVLGSDCGDAARLGGLDATGAVDADALTGACEGSAGIGAVRGVGLVAAAGVGAGAGLLGASEGMLGAVAPSTDASDPRSSVGASGAGPIGLGATSGSTRTAPSDDGRARPSS